MISLMGDIFSMDICGEVAVFESTAYTLYPIPWYSDEQTNHARTSWEDCVF